ARKPGTSCGRMPANESLAARAIVTAGFANDVDAVNQYAATMYAATAKGVTVGIRRLVEMMTPSRPKVATASLRSSAGELRAVAAQLSGASSNIAFATTAPKIPPTT